MAQLLRAALIGLALLFSAAGWAATGATVTTAPDWAALTPAQRELLKPLQAEWNSFSQLRRLKWIGIADRYPRMSPPEQNNVRERMADWSKLTPEQRDKAREQYKKLRSTSPAERQLLEQKWREYEALPEEQKRALKAAPKPTPKVPAAGSAPLAGKQTPKPLAVAPHIVKPSRKPAKAPDAASAPK